jgi:hypothetical protein
MNWLPPVFAFVFAWGAVFSQTQFGLIYEWLGASVNPLPALMIHAGLTHSSSTIAGLAIFAAISLDALSPMKIGTSIIPLFTLAYVMHVRRHLILRNEAYARVSLGFGGGLFVPVATLAILTLSDRPILSGWSTLWQIGANGVFNALMCPVCFGIFDWLEKTFGDPPAVESSFRPDRQIKRGRN